MKMLAFIIIQQMDLNNKMFQKLPNNLCKLLFEHAYEAKQEKKPTRTADETKTRI